MIVRSWITDYFSGQSVTSMPGINSRISQIQGRQSEAVPIISPIHSNRVVRSFRKKNNNEMIS